MRKIVTAALLIASVGSPALAQPSDIHVSTGNELLTVCEAASEANIDWFRQGLCNGFMEGISCMSSGLGYVCLPKGVTYGQVHDVMLAGLRNHPEERQKRADWLALKYLEAAFPCTPAK